MYPSLYYLFQDLFGIELPFLKMVQSFGFFVAIAFLLAAYFLSKELKRKENGGLLSSNTIKVLRGQKATSTELIISGIIGFLIGYKLLYIVLDFTAFTENTQGFLLSTKVNIIGGILGAAISAYLKYREKEKTKLDQPVWEDEIVHPYQHVGNITLIAAGAGLLGAKLFHNLENWNSFIKDPLDALLSFDGLTMYGGLICASIACIYYARKKGIGIPHLIDATGPSLMLAYGVGRIGCHIAGDGDWGEPNTNPKPSWLPDWLWSYDYPNNVLSDGVPIDGCEAEKYCNHLVPGVYPTPLYEAIMCILLFFVLWNLRKRITTPGVLFSVYLIFNGIERFLIEKIRVNNEGFLGLTQAEYISSILAVLGIIGVWYFNKIKKQQKI